MLLNIRKSKDSIEKKTLLKWKDREKVTKALNNASSFIRGKLFGRVEIRKMPELTFVYDESIEYGNKIEKIIEEIKEDGE